MANSILLTVSTPNGIFFEGEVGSFVVPSVNGPVEISPLFTNIITILLPSGVMKITKDHKASYYAVFGGVLRVDRTEHCYLFTEEINDGYEIDMARAIAARDRNLDRINKNESDDDVRKAKIKLAKALARIDAKSLSEGKHR